MGNEEKKKINKDILKQKIRESVIFQEVQNEASSLDEKSQLFLTSFIGLSISIALQDKKIFKSELETIIGQIPSSLGLTEATCRKLVEINLANSQLSDGFSVMLAYYVHYLRLYLGEENRFKILSMFFSLGYTDENLTEEELKFIGQLGRKMGFELDKIKEARALGKKNKINIQDDQEIDYYNNLKSSGSKVTQKRFLKSLKLGEIIEYEKKLNENPHFYFIQKICPKMERGDQVFCAAYLGTIFSIISSDSKIHEKEIKYIRDEFSQWYNFEGTILDKLFDLCIYLFEAREDFSKYEDTYIDVLEKFLDKREKERFVFILFNLAESDENVSENEVVFIEKIGTVFEFSSSKIEELKDEALGIDGSFKIIRSASTWDMLN